METTSRPGAAPRPASPRAECCTDLECTSGLRNNYFEGKRLTPRSFLVEQRYLVERRRLLNRAVHGWGVVYGYPVAPGSGEECRKEGVSGLLKIGPGLALDACGRELLQTGEVKVAFQDLILFDRKGIRTDRERLIKEVREWQQHQTDRDPCGACWLLSAHYAEQRVEPVTVSDPCQCDRHEWDRTCETVRYSLRHIPCDECCGNEKCELKCDCGTSPYCESHAESDDERVLRGRGGRCLCEHLTRLEPDCDCERLCEIEEPCARARVDVHHGVPLACVELIPDECGGWALGPGVEACGPRRLVKRNDVLFDLIRGCDLTHISEIGWDPWHRREAAVPFDHFANAFGPDGQRQKEYVTRDFWVRFSRPVRRSTLLPDAFAMTILTFEREGGWWQPWRVPIMRVEASGSEAGDPHDHARLATIVVDGPWLEDAVWDARTLFVGYETRVEIEVRGDFIVDCNGQTVDANPRGLSPDRTGNGTPGGTFLSTFRVAEHDTSTYRAAPRARDRQGASS
jgi:hypothetical protein